MMLNETLAEKKIHICIFPKSSQQRCNIFKNASIFLKNLGCNIYAFDAWYDHLHARKRARRFKKSPDRVKKKLRFNGSS